MILATDVHYTQDQARIAGVTFANWDDEKPDNTYFTTLENVAPYKSGQFYKRELPCLLQLLDKHQLKPKIILVDGYVFLDGERKPGLGKHLFDALEGKVKILGVAKRHYGSISKDYAIYRGISKYPLYITAIGMESHEAKDHILKMHGKHRIPTLLKEVDRLARCS